MTGYAIDFGGFKPSSAQAEVRMIRRVFLLGATALLTSLAALPAQGAAENLSARESFPSPGIVAGAEKPFVTASNLAALVYEETLTERQVIERAESDAARLGLELVRTFAFGNVAVFKGSQENLRQRLHQIEDIPARAVWPVVHRDGIQVADTLVVFTDRLLIDFAPEVSESEKIAYLQEKGFVAESESAAGRVLVRTGEQPGLHMIGFAEKIAAEDSRVAKAVFEFLLVVEPTVESNSIQINDPFFERFQWHLWNSAVNTNFGFGTVDEDTDVPRSWMFRKMGSAGVSQGSPFGFSGVDVAIFDSGVQIEHPDLAGAFGTRLGFDAVDGGPPNPGLNLLGAHGTAMAGLVSAQPNNIGIVGIAPDVSLYASRVFGEDYTTTNIRIVNSLVDTIFADVDVNVHPYVMKGITDVNSALAVELEQAFRASFESGRAGFGSANIASAGNQFTSVEYPASSPWTFAVGGVSAEGTAIAQSNAGGVGIDFVMPSYFIGVGPSYSEFGTGFVTTDLTGRNGIAAADSGILGNETGNYAALGRVTNFTATSATNSNLFLGTSVSAAIAGGVVALMYSDIRYDELLPFNREAVENIPVLGRPDADLSSDAYRSRAPLRPNDDSILAKLKNYSDLPGEPSLTFLNLPLPSVFPDRSVLNDLAYIDQYRRVLGFGRPNAARLIAAPEGLPSPDSLFQSAIVDFFEWEFGESAPLSSEFIPDELIRLSQGWTSTPRSAGGSPPFSAVLQPLETLYFADQSQSVTQPPGSGNGFWVWVDSIVDGTPELANSNQDEPNFLYNPEGTYLAGLDIDIISPVLNLRELPANPFGQTDVPTTAPLVATFSIAHELGAFNGSSLVQPQSNEEAEGDPVPIIEEYDTLNFSVTYSVSPESAQQAIDDALDAGLPPPVLIPRTVTLGQIAGDSTANPKQPLESAVHFRESDDDPWLPAWRAGTDRYIPWVPESEMLIRDYTFLVPPAPDYYDQVQLTVLMDVGPSYLPTWVFNTNDFVWEQVFNVRRDMRGFIFTGASLAYVDPGYVQYLGQANFEFGTGNIPAWTASKNDVIVSRSTTSAGIVESYDPSSYVVNPAILDEVALRNGADFLSIDAPITGLAAHPTQELLAITTSDATGGSGALLISTNDGINLRPLVDGDLARGAREPSWARNGQQVLFSTGDTIRLANLLADGSVQIETILGPDHPFLDDFHNPTFDRTAGIIYFAARRKAVNGVEPEDESLNLYIVARNGRIFSYNFDENGNALPIAQGWNGIDLFDFEMTTDGEVERLLFTAFADAPPTFRESEAGVELVDPAVPSDRSRIFVLENAEAIAGSRFALPVYTEVVLQSDNPEDSARWPRVSPDGADLVWVAVTDPVPVDEPFFTGRLVRQSLEPRPFVPSDTGTNPVPTPSVTPVTPAPTPADNSSVTYSGSFYFATSNDGFTFSKAGFEDPPAVGRFEFVNNLPKEVVPGIVGFIAASFDPLDGTNLQVATVNFVAKRNGVANFNILTTPPRNTVAQDSGENDLPTVYGSNGSTAIVSRGEVAPARILLDRSSQTVEQGNLVTVRFLIDTNGQPVHVIRGYLGFDTSLLAYDSGSISASLFDRNLADGALEITSGGSNNVFGYWASPSSVSQVVPDSLYLIRTEISASAGTAASQVPTTRLRVNSENLESAFTVETNSFGDLSLSPNTNQRKINDLLFRPPATLFSLAPEARNYEFSFDMLNFIPGKDPNGGVALHQVDFYRLDEDPRYIALWGFEVPEVDDGFGTTVSFEAFGLSGISGDISMVIKTCCRTNEGVIACAAGNAAQGVRINNQFLQPGFYTVAVVMSRDQEVALNWSSSLQLVGNLGETCSAGIGAGDRPAEAIACDNRVPLSGVGDVGLVQEPFYDGRGFYPQPTCQSEIGATVVKSVSTVYDADFRERSARDAWDQGPEVSPFSFPEYSATQSSLALRVVDPAQTFGFWTSNESVIGIGDTQLAEDSPVLIYRATYRVAAKTESNPISLPDIRVRLATNDFQRSASALLISVSDGATAPVSGQPREIQLYMVLENIPRNMNSLIAGFDVLSFYPPEIFTSKPVTSQPIELERVKIERVHIPSYPPLQ